MQKQKAGKKKNICICSRDDLTVPDWKIFWLVGRLLNGDLTQALQHRTVENLPAAIFIYLVVTAVGSVAFALPGISLQSLRDCCLVGVGDDLLYSCSYFGSSCSFSLRQIFSERYSRGSCQKKSISAPLTV